MDTIAMDKTREAVERDILGLILDKTRVALDNGRFTELFVSAPDEEWKKLDNAALCDVKKVDVSAGIGPDCAIHSPVREVEFCFV